MKKKWCGVIGLVLAVWLVTGCANSPYIINKSVPVEESSHLYIQDCEIVEFDGKGTGIFNNYWRPQDGACSIVVIPAGQHTLVFAGARGGSLLDLLSVDFKKTHTFLPAHKYYLTGYGTIEDITISSSELTPDPASPDATPLEGIWVNEKNPKEQIIFSKNEFSFTGKNKYRGGISFEKDNLIKLDIFAFSSKGEWLPRIPVRSAKFKHDNNRFICENDGGFLLSNGVFKKGTAFKRQ